MPIMDGFEATTEIRKFEHEEKLHETHIIALTASILDDDIQRCFDSGMNDYLQAVPPGSVNRKAGKTCGL